MKSLLFPVFLIAAFCVLSGNANAPKEEDKEKVKYPPVSTFRSSCARCHGPQGSSFGDSFGALPDKELVRFIGLMMRGPGGLNPNQADLDAMTAYNRALAKKRPFIFLTKVDSTSTGINYLGEGLPGTIIFLNSKGESLQIKTGTNGKWQSGPVAPSLYTEFIGVEKGDTVKLVPGKALWTN